MDPALPHYRVRDHTLWLILVAVLAILTYLPVLRQPFISDDYGNIAQARISAPVSAWPAMVHDPVIVTRSTSWVAFYWLDRLFGLDPVPFYLFNILLHILCCFLIYALGSWDLIGYRLSGFSAAFFAVFEGHQEAVMWLSACNELFQFFFGVASLLLWLHFLRGTRPRYLYLTGSLVSFLLALVSKESAVIFAPLFFLPIIDRRIDRRRFAAAIPFVVLAVVDTLFILSSRGESFRFRDGSFDLNAPFLLTWANSFVRLLFIWGWLALLVLIGYRTKFRPALVALLWIGITLVPYVFLTYMPKIPSRQTYLASMGLAFIVGLAYLVLADRYWERRKPFVAALALIVIAVNIGYVWIKKSKQFLERAESTEQLISFVRNVEGNVFVRCFPYPAFVGDKAVEVALNRPPGTLIWDGSQVGPGQEVPEFCYQEPAKTQK